MTGLWPVMVTIKICVATPVYKNWQKVGSRQGRRSRTASGGEMSHLERRFENAPGVCV